MERCTLQGPFPLDAQSIDSMIQRPSPGTYVLGRDDRGQFEAGYVGRSDTDVASSLKEHLGEYAQFKFVLFDSAREAFDKECILYHDFGGRKLDSRLHPARRHNSGWQCPRCKVFDY